MVLIESIKPWKDKLMCCGMQCVDSGESYMELLFHLCCAITLQVFFIASRIDLRFKTNSCNFSLGPKSCMFFLILQILFVTPKLWFTTTKITPFSWIYAVKWKQYLYWSVSIRVELCLEMWLASFSVNWTADKTFGFTNMFVILFKYEWNQIMGIWWFL